MVVCDTYIMWLKQFKLWKVFAVVGNIVVADMLYIGSFNVIWKSFRWTGNWAITPQKQPKTFFVQKVKVYLIKAE